MPIDKGTVTKLEALRVKLDRVTKEATRFRRQRDDLKTVYDGKLATARSAAEKEANEKWAALVDELKRRVALLETELLETREVVTALKASKSALHAGLLNIEQEALRARGLSA